MKIPGHRFSVDYSETFSALLSNSSMCSREFQVLHSVVLPWLLGRLTGLTVSSITGPKKPFGCSYFTFIACLKKTLYLNGKLTLTGTMRHVSGQIKEKFKYQNA